MQPERSKPERARPKHPLDDSIRDRLHLGANAQVSLRLVRGVIQTCDALSRAVWAKPFFALNETEALLRDLDGLRGTALTRALLEQRGGTEIAPHGLENVPAEGPVVVASTHAAGLLDFIGHAAVLTEKRPDLKVVANEDALRFLGEDLVVPVGLDPRSRTRSAQKTRAAMVAHLDGGGALLIFGSGRVPYRTRGYLVEPGWRAGPTRVSQACNAPIVPAALNARNSDAYYRTRSWAYKLSRRNDNFAAMIASLRHAQELFDKFGGRYEVIYGAPMPPGTPATELKARAEALAPGLYGPA